LGKLAPPSRAPAPGGDPLTIKWDGRFLIKWFDTGKEPRIAPDPDYPNGIDLDVSYGAKSRCATVLPYPAKRIGHYVVECRICGLKVSCTTAGRADDPRSIIVACKTEDV
jgi:hypothetical protein